MHFVLGRKFENLTSPRCALTALAVILLSAVPVSAQLRGQILVSGLTHPVAFVQDPTNPAVQYVVQKEGVIRTVHNGSLLPTPFLDLSDAITTDGERGLLCLAFPPDAAATGRFFVSFADSEGSLVVSRFQRSGDPLVADRSTRFDLQWSTGGRAIPHTENIHYSGNLIFGPDGLLFIGVGDGGEPNDASHQAQATSSLLGKLLRVDVNVGGDDPKGLNIPAGNPFIDGGGAPEVWAIGLRNPWRFSIDDPARGGTGALLLTDVGEDTIEELNYEPTGRPGRNYGWRNREGAHDHASDPPPAYGPLTDPMFEYDHGFGRSITGGFVYRGTGNAAMSGRYIFGDFVRGKICSIAIAVDGNGEGIASDLRDHSSEVGASVAFRTISSFGIDASGEIYAVNYADGTIIALKPPAAQPVPRDPVIQVDTPSNGTHVRQPFTITGYALDPSAPNPGIGTIHVWAFSSTGQARFLGVATYGLSRPDIAAIYGPQFTASGYSIEIKGLAPGDYLIGLYAWVNAAQNFTVMGSLAVTIDPSGMIAVDLPTAETEVASTFIIAGWALDPAAVSGTGVSTIHMWGFRAEDGAAVFLGVPDTQERPDVAQVFGQQFRLAGYGKIINTLTPGTWWISVYALSSLSGQFDSARMFWVTVR
jgi:glucose/arabinose dehydrogenase